MNFINKTKYKLKLLFTDPIKLMGILKSMLMSVFVKKIDTGLNGTRWTTDNEKNLLQKYAAKATLGIVEIGILDGGTTKEIAQAANVPIYGIDPLIPDSMNKKLIGSEDKIMRNLSFYPQFIFFKDFSYNLAKDWTHPFDFIFIDGDHTYEAVKQDLEDWLPLIKENGYIGFHDSAPVTIAGEIVFEGWPGCVQFVEELKKDNRLKFIEVGDSLSVFQKC